MIDRRGFILSGAALSVGGCSARYSSSNLRRYEGPEVTRVVVQKSERKLHLLHNEKVLKSYQVALGFAPEGDKLTEGDGKTPEGRYHIDRRNPNSSYHLSLGISYPNQWDVERAAALGISPGGDIFIHGEADRKRGQEPDWTAGCVSVRNREIEEIYWMVQDGTVVDILP